MQDMSSQICGNSNANDAKQLVDRRDGKLYWVTKLADNNCWMTQNLDLDLSKSKALTSADSDVTTSWTPANDTQTGDKPSFTTTANIVQSWDPAQGGMPTYCTDGKCNTTTTTTSNEHYAQGNYYSYAAATAGTAPSASGTAGGSICPKGWKLPLAESSNNTVSGSFYYLLDKYGLTSTNPGTEVNGATYSMNLSPLFFVYGGYVDSSILFDAGSEGWLL